MSIAISMSNDEVKAAVSKLIGTKYSEAVRAEIAKLTNRARVVGPNDPHTMEIDDARIQVLTDDNGVITGVCFG
ncbi:I78 family peptidase inhibitor [Pseudomonas sp. NyZ201]|uniref:I78 family peptidase inhibitor n=1 Tax=Pseudomonas sp. NyZ201 TaxID=3409857 RepID=UPI003CED3454